MATGGMSLRAYFAGQALAGLLASGAFRTEGLRVGYEHAPLCLADDAIRCAKALIAQLEKEQK
jgi:hypothetical protein